jgi:hypothetical protein
MIGCIGTSLQLKSIMTAHNQWLSTTCSIRYWTTCVFSSTVMNDESLLTHRTPLRMNYDSFITPRWLEYRSPSQTVPLLFCVILSHRNLCLLIFIAMETYINLWQCFDLHQRIHCSVYLCLPNRCLANGLLLPAFRQCLPNRCLAMAILVTIYRGFLSLQAFAASGLQLAMRNLHC